MKDTVKKRVNIAIPIIIVSIVLFLGAILLAGIVILLVFMLPKINNKVNDTKIIYGKKYVNEEGSLWVKFNKNGTCERSVDSISCNYKISGNNILITEKEKILDSSITMNYTFRIDDTNNLTHVKTCAPDAKSGTILNCNTVPKLNYKYATTNTYVGPKVYEEEKTTNVAKDTTMMHIEDNCYYLCLVGNDRIIFSFKEDNSFTAIYQSLKLSVSSAKYENSKVVNGTYNILGNTLYLGSVPAPIKFGPNAGVRTQVFNFGGSDCSLVNGNPVESKEPATTDTKTKSEDTKTTDNKSTTKNDSKKVTSDNSDYNNNNYNDNNDTSAAYEEYERKRAEEYKKTQNELLDQVVVSERTYAGASDDEFVIAIKARSDLEYTVKINDKNYGTTSEEDFNLKEGENCFDIIVTNGFNKSRSWTKCKTFTSADLAYNSWVYNLAPNGYCDMRLKNTDRISAHSYNDSNLKCTINGKTFSCGHGTSFEVFMGTHSMTIENKFGHKQTINVNCSK